MGSLDVQNTIAVIDDGILTKSHSNGLQGLVEFDFDVTHSKFGTIHIKNEIPRIKPSLERGNVDDQDIEILLQMLLNWVRTHWKILDSDEEYFKSIVHASVIFTIYTNPYVGLHSKELELNIKMIIWLLIQDDEIEDAVDNGIPTESLKAGTDQLLSVLSNKDILKPIEFIKVLNYPFFELLFTSLHDLHNEFSQHIPNYYQNGKPFRNLLRRFFEAQRWVCQDNIDGRYSQRTMKQWRTIDAFCDGTAELAALVLGVNLPKEIRRNPIFQRMVDIVSANGGFVNDVLGVRKEFETHHKSTRNMVVYKVLEKNIPLDVAVSEVCDLIKTDLEDFVLLKKALLNEFSNQPQLISYINILEITMDGHLHLYPLSKRHRSVNSIRITR